MSEHLADDLRALQAAGRIRQWWLPGMVATANAGAWSRWRAVEGAHERPGPSYQIALSDPATIGCLLALLREAVEPWSDQPGARTDADVRADQPLVPWEHR